MTFIASSLVLFRIIRVRAFTTRAIVLSDSKEDLLKAAIALKQGKLVAIPTETVYGLGANALKPESCLEIFRTKGRPLTDPLIVHVTESSWARELLELSDNQSRIFNVLAKQFWPGPLTIVARASKQAFTPEAIKVLSAGTGMIGIRIPSHPIARHIIDLAQVPIAAPSANRFGHVSPTSAAHVEADLGRFPIFIIDTSEPCAIGIESTVVGLNSIDDKRAITLFRRGGVDENLLEQIVQNENIKLELAPSLLRKSAISTQEAQIAPGQLLTHYSPDNVDTFLWEENGEGEVFPYSLQETVIVDFGGKLKHLSSKARAWKDLSPSANVEEACKSVFDVLRWTETIQGARAVILPDIINVVNRGTAAALDDRLYRAASGKRVGKIVDS